jgi:hypothetical protein
MTLPFLASYVALWILVVFQALVLMGLVIALQRIQRRVFAAPGGRRDLLRGTPVPGFSVRELSGRTLTADDLVGQLTALLFVSANCSSCHTALEDMTGLRHKALGNVIVVVSGTEMEARDLATTYELGRVIADVDSELVDKFNIARTPLAVLVDRSGHIQSYGEPALASSTTTEGTELAAAEVHGNS